MKWNPLLFIAANAIWPLLILMPFVIWKAKPWLRVAYVLVVAVFAASCGQLLTIRELRYNHAQQTIWISETLQRLSRLPEPQRTQGTILLAGAIDRSPLTKDEVREIDGFLTTNEVANNALHGTSGGRADATPSVP